MSMVDFVCKEYNDGKVVADKETRKRIVEIGLKRIARETGIDRNTLRLITRGEPVKSKTLAKLIEYMKSEKQESTDAVQRSRT
jgi:DNA-binding Xre family transcriptional regulator